MASKGRNVPPSNEGSQPSIEEVVTFLRGAGMTITEAGPDLWHVHFSDARVPGKALDEDTTSEQLLELYRAIQKGYMRHTHKRQGRNN